MNCKTSGRRSPSNAKYPWGMLPGRFLPRSCRGAVLSCAEGSWVVGSWVVLLWTILFQTTSLLGQIPVDFQATGDVQKPVDYQNEVRPILANHCFACHGFDDQGRQADLRRELDMLDSASGGASPPIATGRLGPTAMVPSIQMKDLDLPQPPASFNTPISTAPR